MRAETEKNLSSWRCLGDAIGHLNDPGDIIMADDGGAIVIPPKLAPAIIEIAGERDEHEVFVRMKLGQGGDLNKYYPFNAEGRREYEEWLKAQSD